MTLYAVRPEALGGIAPRLSAGVVTGSADVQPHVDDDGEACAFLETDEPLCALTAAPRRHLEPHPVRTNRGPRGGL